MVLMLPLENVARQSQKVTARGRHPEGRCWLSGNRTPFLNREKNCSSFQKRKNNNWKHLGISKVNQKEWHEMFDRYKTPFPDSTLSPRKAVLFDSTSAKEIVRTILSMLPAWNLSRSNFTWLRISLHWFPGTLTPPATWAFEESRRESLFQSPSVWLLQAEGTWWHLSLSLRAFPTLPELFFRHALIFFTRCAARPSWRCVRKFTSSWLTMELYIFYGPDCNECRRTLRPPREHARLAVNVPCCLPSNISSQRREKREALVRWMQFHDRCSLLLQIG